MIKEKIGAILDSYKNGTMDKAEAESKIEQLFTPDKLTWPDDGTVRIAAFIGTKLFDTQIPEDKKAEIIYTGKARNVISFTNITCSVIEGNAHAGNVINSDVINGNAEAPRYC